MPGLLETGANLSSPFASRAVQSRNVSLEDAERDAIQVYYGRLRTQTLVNALMALCFLSILGVAVACIRPVGNAPDVRLGGWVVLYCCAAALAYLVYEYRRKERVFLLEDSFAVERRFSSDVELIRWTDVAKLYSLDQTTETKVSIYFVPVSIGKVHHGKLRLVLVDGREIVLTNRVRDFSAMAEQFALRATAASLESCARFLIDGGTLDFDRLGLKSEGLVYKRKSLGWNDIQRISLDASGTLSFKTPKLWRSPRFNASALPNALLLLKLLSMFGADVYERQA
jgi:hypothetical protein